VLAVAGSVVIEFALVLSGSLRLPG